MPPLYREQRERVEHFRRKAYTAMALAARQAPGVPAAATRNFSRIFGFMVNYLDAHTTDAAAVEEKLDKLCFAFSADPARFAGETALNQAAAAFRRAGAPNDAETSGQLRDGRVPHREGLLAAHGLKGTRIYADYEFLRGKHPEYFPSVFHARAAVEFVLDAPEPGGHVENNLSFVRADGSTGKYYRLELDPRVKNKVNHIRSIHEITAKQYQKTKVGNQSDATNAESPAILPSQNSSRSNEQARTVSDFLRNSIAQDGEKSSLKQDARGQAAFAKDFAESYDAVITLFKEADASTLPHECAHWMKRMMESLVEGGYADARMREDLARINRYLDRQKYESEAGTEAYLEEREEKFARSFEAYLLTGRVPASALETAFASRNSARGITRRSGVKPIPPSTKGKSFRSAPGTSSSKSIIKYTASRSSPCRSANTRRTSRAGPRRDTRWRGSRSRFRIIWTWRRIRARRACSSPTSKNSTRRTSAIISGRPLKRRPGIR